jgi:hypothetical protein
MVMSNMDLSYLGIFSIWKNDLGEDTNPYRNGSKALTDSRAKPNCQVSCRNDGSRDVAVGAGYRLVLQEAILTQV